MDNAGEVVTSLDINPMTNALTPPLVENNTFLNIPTVTHHFFILSNKIFQGKPNRLTPGNLLIPENLKKTFTILHFYPNIEMTTHTTGDRGMIGPSTKHFVNNEIRNFNLLLTTNTIDTWKQGASTGNFDK